MPHSELRIAFYMTKLSRFMELRDPDNETVLYAAVRIQQWWRRWQQQRRTRKLVQLGRVVKWSYFMLRLAAVDEDPSSQALWIEIAQRQLSKLDVTSEEQVKRVFKQLRDEGVPIDAHELIPELAARMGKPDTDSPRQQANLSNRKRKAACFSEPPLDIAQIWKSSNPTLAVATAIVKWKAVGLERLHKRKNATKDFGEDPNQRKESSVRTAGEAHWQENDGQEERESERGGDVFRLRESSGVTRRPPTQHSNIYKASRMSIVDPLRITKQMAKYGFRDLQFDD